MKLLAKLHQPVYEKRLEVLSEILVEHLQEGDRVLDVGCGYGELGKTLGEHLNCPRNVQIEGCEKFPRGGELIPVKKIDGYEIPANDGFYDVTILADVVHHEEEPDRLLKEVLRVTKRYLIVKDHTAVGFLGYARICLIDWAANSPYGVKCLFRYFARDEWLEKFEKLGVSVVAEKRSINLYPPILNWLFGRHLQYFVVVEKRSSVSE